jgi:hypothetical protein
VPTVTTVFDLQSSLAVSSLIGLAALLERTRMNSTKGIISNAIVMLDLALQLLQKERRTLVPDLYDLDGFLLLSFNLNNIFLG